VIRMSAPFKDPRTGIYYFRKVIPSELRAAFGKREYKVSLGTRDPADARSKMAEPAAAYERLLAHAKEFVRGGVTGQARHYVEQWLQETNRDRAWLWYSSRYVTSYTRVASDRQISGPLPDYVFEPEIQQQDDDPIMLRTFQGSRRLPLPTCLQTVAQLPASAFAWPAGQVLEHHQLIPAENMFEAIAHSVQRRMMESIVDFMQEQNSKTAPELPSPPLIVINGGLSSHGPSRHAQREAQVGLTITQAFEAWRDYTKGRARSPQLVQEWDLAVRRFVAMFGDIDLGDIRPQMVRDFREKLLELPGRTKKSIKALPLDEQAVIAAKEGLATLAPATVNKALSALRSVTEHVIDKMSSVPLEINAAKMAKFVEVEDSEDKRLPFDEGDMKAIFRDLVIKDATGISEATLFWMVLLAPFTGCRLEEIGTLRPINVRSEQGIWFIAVERDRAQVRAGQDQVEKSLKSSNSDRDIPIHSVLIRAGFLDYVERRRSEGEEWLFPDLTPNKFGKRTYRVSRLFARYLEDLGITDDEKVFHSFRHSIRRNLRGRAKEEMVDLICGHSDGKVGRRYGRGADMRPLREVIELIDYGGPDWADVVAQARKMSGLEPERAQPGPVVQLRLSV
jgi:integrase